MTLFSLVIGSYRAWLSAGPIIAAFFTVRDSLMLITVCLVWMLSLLRGIGYDIVEHQWGEEASAFVYAFMVLKTIPYTNFGGSYWYMWIAVLGSEIGFVVLKRTRFLELRQYLDVWRKDKTLKPSSSSPSPSQSRPIVQFTWRNMGLLLVCTTLFNAARIWLAYSTQPIPDYSTNDPSLYHPPVIAIDSSSGQYTYTTGYYDPSSYQSNVYQFWSIVGESALVIPFILRIPHFYGPTDDIWKSGLGVFLLYLYLNICEVVGLAGEQYQQSLYILVIVEVCFLFLVICGFNAWANGLHDGETTQMRWQWFTQSLQTAIWLGLLDVFSVLMSEPIVQLLYVIFQVVIIFNCNALWYTSMVTFTPFLRELSCPFVSIVNNELRLFYVYTNSPAAQCFLDPVLPELANVRKSGSRVLSVIYPMFTSLCNGEDTSFTPTGDIVILVLMSASWLVTCINLLQVFPEAEHYVKLPSFWLFSFIISVLSSFISQLAADGEALAFWFFIQSSYSRSYTWLGIGILTLQILCAIACMLMMRHRYDDEVVDEHMQIPTSGMYYYDDYMLKRHSNPFQRPTGAFWNTKGEKKGIAALDGKISGKKKLFSSSSSSSPPHSSSSGGGGSCIGCLARLGIGSFTGLLQKAKDAVASLLNPGLLLMFIAIVILVFAVRAGSPIQSVELVQAYNTALPSWAQITPMDQISVYTASFVSLLSSKLKIELYIVSITSYLLSTEAGLCVDIPGLGAIRSFIDDTIGVFNNIGGGVSNAVNGAESLGNTILGGLSSLRRRRLLQTSCQAAFDSATTSVDSTGNTICIGDLLRMIASSLQEIYTLISDLLDFVVAAVELAMQALSSVIGIELNAFEQILQDLEGLETAVVNGIEYNLLTLNILDVSIGGFEGLIRIPYYFLWIAVGLLGGMIIIMLLSLVNKGLKYASHAYIGAFGALWIAVIFAAIRIKQFIDYWNQGFLSITVSFSWTPNVVYYAGSAFVMLLGMILFALTKLQQSSKSNSVGARYTPVSTTELVDVKVQKEKASHNNNHNDRMQHQQQQLLLMYGKGGSRY
jgi:hypothetical protein